MDAFGRFLGVMLSVVSVAALVILLKTAPFHVQKNETVRSLCHNYIDRILKEEKVSSRDIELLRKQLQSLGKYSVELTVFESRYYEGEKGLVVFYTEQKEIGKEQELLSGYYIRLVVKEEEKSVAESFFYGPGCVIYAGGRVA